MSQTPRPVTRSAAAFSAAAAGRVAQRRLAQPNGWWGMVGFLCAEIVLFGTLIGTYFYLDFDAHRWPPPGLPSPKVLVPLLATGMLVLTSVPMWMAARAARAGLRNRVIVLILGASLVQIVYLAIQIVLFAHDLHDFSPKNSAYGSIYFTLLAADHAHVLLGILLDLAVVGFIVVRGLTNYWLTGARGVAVYWHVVNVVSVFVVVTQLSPSL